MFSYWALNDLSSGSIKNWPFRTGSGNNKCHVIFQNSWFDKTCLKIKSIYFLLNMHNALLSMVPSYFFNPMENHLNGMVLGTRTIMKIEFYYFYFYSGTLLLILLKEEFISYSIYWNYFQIEPIFINSKIWNHIKVSQS